MKWAIIILTIFSITGCENIGLGGSYPSIYTKQSLECGCDGVMYIIDNTSQKAQAVTIVRLRQSGTAPKKRQEINMIIQPRIEKKLGCSEINLFISGRSQYCDTHQSFYVKKYRDIQK